MTLVSKNPRRRLQAIAAIAQWALYVLALAWVTLGLVWGGFHFAIVPRIGELRPWLEQQATQRLGVRLQIGSLQARSNGLIPSVELHDVRLFDSSGRQAVYVPKVTAGLSPRSLLGAAFEQLVVEGAELDVRRAANGQIWIGGLALTAPSQANSPGLDWLFSQTELAVRHGQVRWTDETRNVPTLALRDLDLVIRNRGRTHAIRLDLSPPLGWGGRVTLMGKFLHPLFNVHHGDWAAWQGSMYGAADLLDLAALHEYTDWSAGLAQGRGALRWWADVDHGSVHNATADLGLQSVVVRLAPALPPLALTHIGGRLTLDTSDTAQTWGSDDLAFDTADGLHWPGGKLQLRLARGVAATQPGARSTLRAEQLDLAVLADVALHVPLSDDWQAQIAALAPRGTLRKLQLSWSGAGANATPRKFEASGQLSGMALNAQPLAAPVPKNSPLAGLPGLRGAALDFSLNQSGGQAKLAIVNGAMAFPGIFAQPEIPVAKMSADVSWKIDSRHLGVDVANARFDNADLQGEAHAHWQTADLPRGAPASLRFPGVLDLQGNLSRANVAAVGRYLPLAMEPFSRAYLQQSLLAGKASNVQFRVRGDLSRFPFSDTKAGDFRISADVQNASVAYAPPGLPAGAPDHDGMVWPPLTQVQCSVLLDHDVLEIKGARGLLMPATALVFARTDVTLSKLYTDPQLTVNAEARGPLPEALDLVNHSPLLGLTAQALVRSRVSGGADYKLRLNMPLERPEKTTVQGSVTLNNNEFQYAPEVPRLVRARGVVGFNENGFSLSGVSGRTLGGDVRLDGGLNFAAVPTPGSPSVLRMQGVLTADGLRRASELGPTAKLGRILLGNTPYNMTLTLRGGAPELAIASNLQGMEVKLPAPLGKAADVEMPLRLELYPVHAPDSTSMHLRDVLRFELGQIASVTYMRDISGAVPKVLRGAIGIGLTPEEVAPLPTAGVSANMHIDQLDVDAWIAAIAQFGDATPTDGTDDAAQAYAPNQMALRTNVLTFQGRKINRVLLGAGRENNLWRVNVDAAELNGYLEYRQPVAAATTPGRLYARLARLVIGPSAEQDVEALLDQQPVSIPALDIVVDDMELRGKKLGRVEIQAVNLRSPTAREGSGAWQLDRFNITTPEASLTASGNWLVPDNSPSGRRRTALQFKLDLTDAGALLARMGMPGVIAKGRGLVQGNVAWAGSPFAPDYASMSGGVNTNVETGQFLKADPGIAKLFGVLSLQSLPRRLALDFRDVFSEGFAFDYVRGDVAIADGIARTDNLQMKGVSAAVLMEGQADIAQETQLLKVVVIPEINAGSASLLASAVNPVVGITTFLAQILLRRPLIDATTQEFQIDGTWVDPRVTRIARQPHNELTAPSGEKTP